MREVLYLVKSRIGKDPYVNMSPAEIAMLVCGIVLFMACLGPLLYCVLKRRPHKTVIALSLVSIIMIGFSSSKSFDFLGAKVDTKDAIRR
jgi:hypothetical protein